jgi:chemotaxis protein methyltransferase CheR
VVEGKNDGSGDSGDGRVNGRIPGNERSFPFVGSEFPEEDFCAVRDLLLEKRGFDLAMYKDHCVKRRIATRVRALGFNSAGPYLDILRRNETELDALLAAISIHVSQFFRNPTTFAALEERILPELIRRATLSVRRELRLWSVGCAGGEEPYSLALLLDELAPRHLRVSILATDVSPPVLEQAREGLFDPVRLTEVPEAVRARYFTAEGRNYRLAEHICKMVQFQRHDILTSMEYPAADLILCRNVLIYFSREKQEYILTRFAAALPAGGFLVLGRAETLLGEPRQLFQPECSVERIYRRKQGSSKQLLGKDQY